MRHSGKWFKSSCSNPDACVEVLYDGFVHVRDSKGDQSGPVLTFNSREWQAFLDGVRLNEFDLPANETSR